MRRKSVAWNKLSKKFYMVQLHRHVWREMARLEEARCSYSLRRLLVQSTGACKVTFITKTTRFKIDWRILSLHELLYTVYFSRKHGEFWNYKYILFKPRLLHSTVQRITTVVQIVSYQHVLEWHTWCSLLIDN